MRSHRASSTAVLIARSLVFLRRHPRYVGFVTDDSARWCELLLAESYGGNRSIRRLASPWFRFGADATERLLLPGILAHYALRKTCIGQQARAAVSAGVQQVVVLGAGFDPLARLLHDEFPAVRFWEIDHPATQRVKRIVCGPNAERLGFIPVDFSRPRDGLKSLAAAGHDADRPTLWIAEGLLMYFPVETVRALLNDLRARSTLGSSILFTAMELSPTHGVRFQNQSRFVDFWLRAKNEVFAWGLPASEHAAFLATVGWKHRASFGPQELRSLAPRPIQNLAAGEWVISADNA